MTKAALIFIILHVFVYPSSNGYNSYMDRDESPIGGLSKPLQPTKQLFFMSVAMDLIAVVLSLVIGPYFTTGIVLYILASRAYSYRGIRLKKYPITGYLVVILCQGAVIFFLTWYGSSNATTLEVPTRAVIAASCLIGGYYPLTQVYQHQEDIRDGVRTISYLLGKRGTFVFCGIVFSTATIAMFLTFELQNNLRNFWLFVVCMLPMVWFFSRWAIKVWQNEQAANFKNSLIMNVLATSCTSICFLIIIIEKQF